jgi:hypothetical protein
MPVEPGVVMKRASHQPPRASIRSGIDSVRIRARAGSPAIEAHLEVAILDPAKPHDLELALVRDDAATAWAVIDLADLLSAVQVLRSGTDARPAGVS